MTARTLLQKLSEAFPHSSVKVTTEHTYDRLSLRFDRQCTASITRPRTASTPPQPKLILTGPSYSALLSAALAAEPLYDNRARSVALRPEGR